MTSTDVATTAFTFEVVSLRTTDGHNYEAVVQYDGTADSLRTASQHIRVNTETVQEPSDDQPRLLKLSGSTDSVFAAIREYAKAAIAAGEYSLGDLFRNSNSW